MLELVCFLWSRKSRFEFWWGQEVGSILFLHQEKSKSTLVEFLRYWKGPLLPLFKSAPQEGLKITKLTEGLYSAYANYYLHWKDLWKHVSFWVGFYEISFFFRFRHPIPQSLSNGHPLPMRFFLKKSEIEENHCLTQKRWRLRYSLRLISFRIFTSFLYVSYSAYKQLFKPHFHMSNYFFPYR